MGNSTSEPKESIFKYIQQENQDLSAIKQFESSYGKEIWSIRNESGDSPFLLSTKYNKENKLCPLFQYLLERQIMNDLSRVSHAIISQGNVLAFETLLKHQDRHFPRSMPFSLSFLS